MVSFTIYVRLNVLTLESSVCSSLSFSWAAHHCPDSLKMKLERSDTLIISWAEEKVNDNLYADNHHKYELLRMLEKWRWGLGHSLWSPQNRILGRKELSMKFSCMYKNVFGQSLSSQWNMAALLNHYSMHHIYLLYSDLHICGLHINRTNPVVKIIGKKWVLKAYCFCNYSLKNTVKQLLHLPYNWEAI